MNKSKIEKITAFLNPSFKERELDFRAGDEIAVTSKGKTTRGICIFIRRNGILTKIGVLVQNQNQNFGYTVSFYVFAPHIEIKLIKRNHLRRAKTYYQINK